MHQVITVAFFGLLLFLSGCVITPEFTPTTRDGALCKKECAMQMGRCDAAPYTCDRFHAKCVQACIDLDRVSK